MGWIKSGVAVQVDIHEPHDREKNWHAHLLVGTRRFTEDGKRLGAKARDLNPEFKSGKNGSFIIPEEDIIHERGKRVLKLYRLKPVGSVTRMVFNVVHDHFICNIARCGAKISSPPKSFTPNV